MWPRDRAAVGEAVHTGVPLQTFLSTLPWEPPVSLQPRQARGPSNAVPPSAGDPWRSRGAWSTRQPRLATPSWGTRESDARLAFLPLLASITWETWLARQAWGSYTWLSRLTRRT